MTSSYSARLEQVKRLVDDDDDEHDEGSMKRGRARRAQRRRGVSAVGHAVAGKHTRDRLVGTKEPAGLVFSGVHRLITALSFFSQHLLAVSPTSRIVVNVVLDDSAQHESRRDWCSARARDGLEVDKAYLRFEDNAIHPLRPLFLSLRLPHRPSTRRISAILVYINFIFRIPGAHTSFSTSWLLR